jgi:tetratricopeptide (TPR) repeat protein
MMRMTWLGLFFALTPLTYAAEPVPKDLTKIIATQKAIGVAKDALKQNQPSRAIAVLESQLTLADGNEYYLSLLKDAYQARLEELAKQPGEASQIESLRQRLKAISGASPPSTSNAPPATPVAEPKKEMAFPPSLLGPSPKGYDPSEPLLIPVSPNSSEVKPASASLPIEVPAATDEVASRAAKLFAEQKYDEALLLFEQAIKAKESLDEVQRDQWGYCRLYQITTRLNQGEQTPAMQLEVRQVLNKTSAQLKPFGEKLLAKLDPPAEPEPSPVAVPPQQVAAEGPVESPSFRVHHRGQHKLAKEVAQVAEAARQAMSERWLGPVSQEWTPRCDIYLYSSAKEYAQRTKKSVENAGHSTVNFRGQEIVSRRIDLHADDTNLLDATLPNEVTQVLLNGYFSEQKLPRWAMIGIATLSESPESVARYRRAMPELLRQRKLLPLADFFKLQDFPTAEESITPFYAESVSIVSFLVEQKGPKGFITFMTEVPRRGIAKSMQNHYGFEDLGEFQKSWVRSAMGEKGPTSTRANQD